MNAASLPLSTSPHAAPTVRPWWREPRLTWWFVTLAIALLALRKPWALHTPQFWAEDGSIFLQQDDALGTRAIWEPYMGYLHLLPRLIAWTASRVADVARWPALYNGAAFLLAAALFIRMASPRLAVPGKPWLLLAFVLTAQSGEVLVNVTNLQWLTAFFLLLQLLMDRPATAAQHAGDLALTALVGLTGPFAVLFLPLFAWRWWHDRHRDSLMLLAVVTLCAAVQLNFLLRASLGTEPSSSPFHVVQALTVLGNRLVVWPLLGEAGVRAFPPAVALAACGVLIFPLLLWVLRPHPRRVLRAQLLAAFLLTVAAALVRARVDTWSPRDLVNGDRYFFIPRVLLVWEFDAVPRFVALAARTLCLFGALANFPKFTLPAPPDYHWAAHCDPIRRGTPANIFTLPEGWWIEYPGRPPPK